MDADTDRLIYRFEVPVDGRWHMVAGCGSPLHVACRRPDVVEFWAWHWPGAPARSLRVHGTGQPVPAGTTYWGTAIAPGDQLVWHLLERP